MGVLSFRLSVCLGVLAAASAASAQSLTRGPYLQQGSHAEVTVRWRTSSATDSRVWYGTAPGSPAASASVAGSRTEHVVRVTGLSAETRYFYSIGSASVTLASGEFRTSPPPGAARSGRIWVIGDAGTKDSRQRSVRDAYDAFNGSARTDLWLMLGDNAYLDGTDEEYQDAVFDMYKPLLATSVVWPTFGNHDGQTASSATQSGPYYDLFTLPKNGECGGLASGTEAYYSFDWGNVHFLCLDSYESDRSVNGPMWTWARNDLAATSAQWLIAFFHHPPYTKGSHDSDTGSPLIAMRKNFLPMLEDAGVDLVLAGHSHVYERSYLLDGHYGLSTTLTSAMKKDGGSGRDAAPYRKSSGTQPHEGAVYIVAGSSGHATGGPLNHPAMFVSLNEMGSVVLDVSPTRLDAKFIRETGAIDDWFSIVKGDAPSGGDATNPTVAITSPTAAATWTSTSNALDLAGTASDNVGLTGITWSNSASKVKGTASGTTAWSATVPLIPGANLVTFYAWDAAGNRATDAITIDHVPPSGDATAPSLAIQGPSEGTVASEPARIIGTASDGVGVTRVEWSNAATGESGAASGTASWSASVDLASGPNVITVTAWDAAGNRTSDAVTLTYAPGAPGGSGSSGGGCGTLGVEPLLLLFLRRRRRR